MATAACHLCESTARGSSHCRASSSVTRWARAPAHVEPDVGHLDLAGEPPTRRQQQARLQRGERHRAGRRRSTPSPGRAGQRRRRRSGCRRRAPRRRRRRGRSMSRGSPCRSAASMTRSAAGSRAGASATSTTRTAAPARARRRAAARPSLPLFPFPARTTTRRPYVPPIIRSGGAGHGGRRASTAWPRRRPSSWASLRMRRPAGLRAPSARTCVARRDLCRREHRGSDAH